MGTPHPGRPPRRLHTEGKGRCCRYHVHARGNVTGGAWGPGTLQSRCSAVPSHSQDMGQRVGTAVAVVTEEGAQWHGAGGGRGRCSVPAAPTTPSPERCPAPVLPTGTPHRQERVSPSSQHRSTPTGQREPPQAWWGFWRSHFTPNWGAKGPHSLTNESGGDLASSLTGKSGRGDCGSPV